MPSPIAHTAVGWALQRLPAFAPLRAATGWRSSRAVVPWVAVFFSLLPDLPTVAGFAVGDLEAFHNRWEHSLFSALVVAAVTAAIAWWARLGSPARWSGLAFCCYAAHVVMDYFTVGRGVMLLWPLSTERFSPPVMLFYGLHWSEGWISVRHLWTVATEGAFGLLLAFLVWRLLPKRRRPGPTGEATPADGERAMRIGLMLRAFDEKGGVGVYTRNIVEELLNLDQQNDYVLFYRSAEHLGRFAERANVEERVVRAAHKAIWDQVAIPLACRREKVDVVFHPKFTAPLLAPCKAVMTVHGADWFVPEQAQFYGWLDVRYIRAVMPWYFRKCAAVISVSQLTTDNFNRVLGLRPGKVKTVYFAPARRFRRVEDREELERVRTRYDLPERFIFTLTKRSGGGRKNLRRLLEAYALYHEASQPAHQLVIGGKDCHLYRQEYSIPEHGYGADILFPGWLDQEDLPAVYSLADLYLYPSNLEAFPIPITEAMACGTPIVTSDVNGLEEIAGEAAVRVDPQKAEEIAGAMTRVLGDEDLRRSLSRRGLERSLMFSWDKCARETLEILEEVHAG